MNPQLQVHLLPQHAQASELDGASVVVVDVLRATTTITHALAAGASEVIPCLKVEDALHVAAKLGDGAVLGGERDGLPIDGFHLGNSPAEYTEESVGGRTLVFTTTNGTRAMRACRDAEEVLLGAFVNVAAVAIRLAGRERVHLVCAGTRGEVTREDVLLAGLLVEKLVRRSPIPYELNDEAVLARDAWRGLGSPVADLSIALKSSATEQHAAESELAEVLTESRGGRDLVEIGLGDDIGLAARVDRFDIVPLLDTVAWKIGLP